MSHQIKTRRKIKGFGRKHTPDPVDLIRTVAPRVATVAVCGNFHSWCIRLRGCACIPLPPCFSVFLKQKPLHTVSNNLSTHCTSLLCKFSLLLLFYSFHFFFFSLFLESTPVLNLILITTRINNNTQQKLHFLSNTRYQQQRYFKE
jgi:hypothetical protein